MEKVVFLVKNWELVGNYLLYRFKDQHFILAALKGLRNGVIYGAKIRAPHALVMVFLFGEGTFLEKIKLILRLTKQHATNLAKFVFGYKFLVGALEKAHGRREWHSMAAAAAVAYFVFGENNNVNMQINLYLLSRITIGLAKLAQEKEFLPQPSKYSFHEMDLVDFPVFPLFAAAVWGIVLWLFEYHQHVLQGSLQKSMTYLYHDSNFWTDIRNFVLRNK